VIDVKWFPGTVHTSQPTLAGPLDCAVGDHARAVARPPHQTVFRLRGEDTTTRDVRRLRAAVDRDRLLQIECLERVGRDALRLLRPNRSVQRLDVRESEGFVIVVQTNLVVVHVQFTRFLLVD
jgi:hypothetical protein